MVIADLHIHSRFSRATSRDCDAPHLDLWARRKGIGLIGTGDFTHPVWREELREALVPDSGGLYTLRDDLRLPCEVNGSKPRFVVSGEISTIYKRDGKTRKVHHVILLPGLEEAETLAHHLEAVGNLHSDGRPILGMDSYDLLKLVKDVCPEAIYIPAHIWTPHFSLFGAFSDFSTVEECYGDLAGEIHAMETGLSSDPAMNRRLSMLDRYTLVSNSDAHSPAKLGREANMLDDVEDYASLRRAIETGEGFRGTIEFFPEEGKYHLDGHRKCQACLEPSETVRLGGLCPVCGRKLTVGVLHRVEALADRDEPMALPKPYESLIPLPELLSSCLGASPASRRVQETYSALLRQMGDEFTILRNASLSDARAAGGPVLEEALRRLREGRVIRRPGYDGEYGVISLFEPGETDMLQGQTSLLSLAGLAQKARPSAAGVKKRVKADLDIDEAVNSAAPTLLNLEQEAAVHAEESTVAVIAGPGTGKTKTLISRIAYLVEEAGVSPREITAVTFTRQAAQEMRERLTARLGKRAANAVTVGTFHAIALTLIPKKPVIGRVQALEAVERLLKEHGEKLSAAEGLRLLSLYNNANRTRTPACAALPAWLPEAYDQYLQDAGMRDLDGVLLEALNVPVKGKRAFQYLLVDEYQDINAVQHALVLAWAEHGKSLFVIGDPDQAIYGFRGADAACFDRLMQARPDTRLITLRSNYRSTPQVIDCARNVFAGRSQGAPDLVATRPDGAAVRVVAAADAFSEAVWIAKEIGRMAGGVDMLEAQSMEGDNAQTRSFVEIAVLTRTRRQLEVIEGCLAHDDIPAVILGRDDFLNEPWAQGMLGFFASLDDPRDAASLRDALTELWRVPDALCQRAAAALADACAVGEMDREALRRALPDDALLLPWLEALDELVPRVAKEKPRKLLEELARLCGIRHAEKLLNIAVFHDSMSALLDTLTTGEEADIRRMSGHGSSGGAVRLMTLHAAKGLEFPVVFLVGVTKGTLPLERAQGDVDLEEERRLFYVGVTRARDELILCHGGEPSPFLECCGKETRRISARSLRRAPQAEQLSFFG